MTMVAPDPMAIDVEGRVPSDREIHAIEQAVIASALLDSSVLRFVVDDVQGSDFGDTRLGVLFEQMVARAARREPVDILTVAGEMAGWGVRGLTFVDLDQWVSAVPSSAHVGWYARKVREAATRRLARAEGARLLQAIESVDAPGEIIARSVERLRALQDTRRQHVEGPRLLDDILDESDTYDWVIPDLLERGDRFMLTGQEGGGKSTLGRQLGVMAAAGLHPFANYQIEPQRVLFVDAENSERQWRRTTRGLVMNATHHGQVNPASTMRVRTVGRLDLLKDQDLGMIHRWLDDCPTDILFIGPLYRLTPQALNDDDTAAPLLAALDTFRERGMALVIEAHAGHTTSKAGVRDLRPRGSSQLLGWPEFGFGLRLDPGGRTDNDFQLVRWRGDRDQRKWPTRISRGTGTWPWTASVTDTMRLQEDR